MSYGLHHIEYILYLGVDTVNRTMATLRTDVSKATTGKLNRDHLRFSSISNSTLSSLLMSFNDVSTISSKNFDILLLGVNGLSTRVSKLETDGTGKIHFHIEFSYNFGRRLTVFDF